MVELQEEWSPAGQVPGRHLPAVHESWNLGIQDSGIQVLDSSIQDPESNTRNLGSGILEIWESGNLESGNLGSGIWELGIWDLGSGIWDLRSGIWDLGSGFWDLGSGILGPGIWVPTGSQIIHSFHRINVFRALHQSGVRISKFVK